MREKLIELLKHDACKGRTCEDCYECEYYGMQYCYFTAQADHLIANGVTVTDNNVGGKWIPVTERLPQEDVRVLVWLTDGVNSYTKMDTDRIHNNRWVRWGMYVTHWMPLPEPPKGE